MSDGLITRKPTPAMVEMLRQGAADPHGRITIADHNDRTQDGILRRDMADIADGDGPWLSYLVINNRGRAYLAKLDAAAAAPEEPLCIRCHTVGDDSMPHRETEAGHLCGYCAAVLDDERQQSGKNAGASLDTLREFSREVADADEMATATVRVNREERGAALSVGGARVLGRDNAYWRVAWVADERGRVIVCFWSASSNLDTPDGQWAEEPVSAPQTAQERPAAPVARPTTAQCDLHSCGGCAETCCPPVETFPVVGKDDGTHWNACRSCIRQHDVTPVDGWTGAEGSLPAEEPVSAPQQAPAAPVAQEGPAAPSTPALGDLARVSVETVQLGTRDTLRVRPAYVVTAYGSSHHFAEVEPGAWVAVCGRCGGTGELQEHRGVYGGVCFGCNRRGLRPDVFSGTVQERDAFVYAWALKQERKRVAAEKRAAREHAKRVAAWERWESANADLVAWCRSLTPDRIEEYDEGRQSLEDTREDAERLYGEGETLVRSGQFTEGVHAGRWWADFRSVERFEVFDSYGSRAAGLIQRVRKGFEPLDAQGTALLSKIMRSAVQAQATTRYAGPVGAEVSVTGRVKRVKIVDSRYGSRWSTSRMIVLEGTGEHAGVTVVAYSGSAAAKALEDGQEGVTITGTVAKHREYSGARETRVQRPRITA